MLFIDDEKITVLCQDWADGHAVLINVKREYLLVDD